MEVATQEWKAREQFGLVVGDRAHRIVGEVLRQGFASERDERTMQILAVARQVLREYPTEYRQRAVLLESATAASCYLLRFALPNDWLFQGAEVSLGDGRIDLAFVHCRLGKWLIDEIKTGVARNGESDVRPQIDRYLASGLSKWGDDFAGVRLCAVAAPSRSKLYLPGRKRSLVFTDETLAVALS